MLCVLVVVLSMTTAWFLRRSFPQVHGDIKLPGLEASVDVVRDIWGVPQIYADSSTDLFMAQGYVHAQDRFFEMDFRRHVTSGRLSEMFGESQVETDASIRTMGWRVTAEKEWNILDATTRDYFTAYAAGVNAYLADKSPGEVSLEYAMLSVTGLDYEIEEWDPVDSLAWLKAMAWDLRGNYGDELSRASLAASGMTTEAIAQLYPDYPTDWHTPIVPEGTVVDGVFDADADAEPDKSISATETSVLAEDALLATLDATSAVNAVIGAGGADGIGSNSWVVSGDLTETGKPILANDPHLGPAMPSVWYQAGLHCTDVSTECPFDVAGFSFAGVPGVMIGHNGQIAWGFTNLGPDVTDFYYERIDGDKYLVEDEWLDLAIREETIEVANGDPVTITIRETQHGPLMSDRGGDPAALAADASDNLGIVNGGSKYGLALRWTALDPGRTADAIFALNKASNFTEFKAAAALFEVPAQNLVYADVDGNIAYQSPGRIPIRGKGDGTVPVPGWDPDYDWTGYIPFEELPVVENPDEGFIVTANNEVIGDQYPYLLTNDWAYGYRSQRIRDMISEADGKISVDDMHAMQLDSANEGAEPILDALSALSFTGVEKTAVGLLDGWDLQQPADSAPAAFYNSLWRNLLLKTFDEMPEGREPGGGERWAYIVSGMMNEPDDPWWDDLSTSAVETRDDMLKVAVTDAVAELTELLDKDPNAWEWGDLHTLTVTHQTLGTSGIGFVEWMFNADTVAAPGGDGLVNATGWNAAVGYEVDAVPSMRMVVDMSDFDNSLWINLTGASGHAFQAHYADQLPLWRDGKMLPMLWTKEKFASDSAALLRLVP
ncbi:Penicillin acylase family protein [Stackebrandtia soli]